MSESRAPASPSRRLWILITVLLIPPVVLPLWVPLYNKTEPELNGWPFFFWFQMALIPSPRCSRSSRSRCRGQPTAGTVRPAVRSCPRTSDERRRGQRLRLPVPRRHRPRLRRRTLAPRRDGWTTSTSGGSAAAGFGTFIAWFLIGGDLYTAYTFIAVPGDPVRRQRGRLLRGALHDRGLPAHLPVPAEALVGLAPPRLRHAGRLRAGSLRQQAAGAGRRRHRHPRDDALHRPAAGRHPGRPRRDGDGPGQRQLVRQGPAAVRRVRGAGGLHLLQRPAGAGADRVRQGHPDLHRDHRRGALPALAARRLGPHLRRRPGLLRHLQRRERRRDRGRGGRRQGR